MPIRSGAVLFDVGLDAASKWHYSSLSDMDGNLASGERWDEVQRYRVQKGDASEESSQSRLLVCHDYKVIGCGDLCFPYPGARSDV